MWRKFGAYVTCVHIRRALSIAKALVLLELILGIIRTWT